MQMLVLRSRCFVVASLGVFLALSYMGFALTLNAAEAVEHNSAQVFEELAREADQAREERRIAQQAWQEEEARLRLLIAALNDESQRLTDKTSLLRAENAELAETIQAIKSADEHAAALSERTQELTKHIDQELAQTLANSALLFKQMSEQGSSELPPASDALALRTSLNTLARREQQTRSISRHQLSGLLPNGKRQVASVLAMGGAAGWWLTETASGTVRVVDGTAYFDPVDNAQLQQAIRQVFAAHQNQADSGLFLLPVPNGPSASSKQQTTPAEPTP